MSGGIGECPREDQGCDTLEDLEDEVDSKKLGLVFWTTGKSV